MMNLLVEVCNSKLYEKKNLIHSCQNMLDEHKNKTIVLTKQK